LRIVVFFLREEEDEDLLEEEEDLLEEEEDLLVERDLGIYITQYFNHRVSLKSGQLLAQPFSPAKLTKSGQLLALASL
jgi:hypothetical protein